MKFALIAAADSVRGIGKNGHLPWHVPSDLAYFQSVTTGSGRNAVIMGRTTWESLPRGRKPLQDRLNIVLSRMKGSSLAENFRANNFYVASSLEEAFRIAQGKKCKDIFVIGGAKVFNEVMQHPDCAKIYLTEIEGDFGCDAFFPKINPRKFESTALSEQKEENGIYYQFAIYERIS